MDNDLDTLATALYVTTDDFLKQHPHLAPWRPKIGSSPQISDAELITLAVMQALLEHHNERRWVRNAEPTSGICSPRSGNNRATTSGYANSPAPYRR